MFIFIITLYWKRDSAKWDSAKRDSAKRDSAKRDSAKRDSAKRDSAKRDSAKRGLAKRDSVKRDSAKREDTDYFTCLKCKIYEKCCNNHHTRPGHIFIIVTISKYALDLRY